MTRLNTSSLIMCVSLLLFCHFRFRDVRGETKRPRLVLLIKKSRTSGSGVDHLHFFFCIGAAFFLVFQSKSHVSIRLGDCHQHCQTSNSPDPVLFLFARVTFFSYTRDHTLIRDRDSNLVKDQRPIFLSLKV